MNGAEELHEFSNRIFIDYCKDKFGWKDLSKDVIMDVGCSCGGTRHCRKAILDAFPDVGAIIAVDVNPNVMRDFRVRNSTNKIDFVIADIEKRETLRNYEGKMSKVVSTYLFHKLADKEVAFRNIFHLLKPGGEAAVLFLLTSVIYDWLMELLKNPKWKEAFQAQNIEDMYKSGFGAIQYREMVQKIGFKIIVGREEMRTIPYPKEELSKESVYNMCSDKFKVSPEQLEEFQEECIQTFLKLSPRDSDGKPCYRSTEMYLLLLKPTDDSDSWTKRQS